MDTRFVWVRAASLAFVLLVAPAGVARGEDAPALASMKAKELRALAKHGDASAQVEMGARCYRGTGGVPQDPDEARKWFERAAEQGDAWGQYNLGILHQQGVGVRFNFSTRSYANPGKAAEWFRKAAEQGLAPAEANLGVLYMNGAGVPQDTAEAVKWTRSAAEHGDASGQNNLGHMYEAGFGLTPDTTEAVAWFRKSAEQNLPSGQRNLGRMYENGTGVAQDDVRAHMWYALSSRPVGGVARGVSVTYKNENLERVEARMTPEQIEEAKRLAEEWRAAHAAH